MIGTKKIKQYRKCEHMINSSGDCEGACGRHFTVEEHMNLYIDRYHITVSIPTIDKVIWYKEAVASTRYMIAQRHLGVMVKKRIKSINNT
jgi:hypothetical protein